MFERNTTSALTERRRARFAAILLFILCACFLVSLFGNISHPLFWADESMTVMHGERVLDFGYPKVHNGKNVVYDLRYPDLTLGIDARTDAFIGGANWGQYYFAAPWVRLAELANGLYAKTAIIRIPFALAGLAGLVLLAFLGRSFFATPPGRTGFLSLFALIELLSIPLVLHLREVRYYSLTVLFLSLAIVLYVRYRILGRTGPVRYTVLSALVLLLLYITFSPAYFIVFVTVVANELLLLVQTGEGRREAFRQSFLAVAPFLASLLAVIPLSLFFRTFEISAALLSFNTRSAINGPWHLYRANLVLEWHYFAWSDLLLAALVTKTLLVISSMLTSSDTQPDLKRLALSRFLSLLFLVYFLAIAKVPNPLFTRYFIELQPVLALILLLDLSMLYERLASGPAGSLFAAATVMLLFAGTIVFTVAMNGRDIEGHVQELAHPLRGPLDYAIPFLRERYRDTKDLVIATNYEETSFMYYLGAKVIVGFVGNNLAQDALAVPDVIVYRRGWGNFGSVFNSFLERARYRRVILPVVDEPVNNIPELNWQPPFRHRFRTEEAVSGPKRLELFLRVGNGVGGGAR